MTTKGFQETAGVTERTFRIDQSPLEKARAFLAADEARVQESRKSVQQARAKGERARNRRRK